MHSAEVDGRFALFEEHFRTGQAAGALRAFDTRTATIALTTGLDAVVTAAAAPPGPVELARLGRELADLYVRASPPIPRGIRVMIDQQSGPDAGLRRVVRANVLTVVVEVVVPMALFCGLRAAGVGQWWALRAGVLVVAPYVVWTVVRRRRVDLVALVTASVLVLSVVLGLLSDDPRALAIREGGPPHRAACSVCGCWSRSFSAGPRS